MIKISLPCGEDEIQGHITNSLEFGRCPQNIASCPVLAFYGETTRSSSQNQTPRSRKRAWTKEATQTAGSSSFPEPATDSSGSPGNVRTGTKWRGPSRRSSSQPYRPGIHFSPQKMGTVPFPPPTPISGRSYSGKFLGII
jgi:hypothetical protein